MTSTTVSSINLSSYLSEEFTTKLFDSVINQLSGVTNICFLLCGLFSFAFFANTLMKTWAKGEAIDFHALFRPFVIGIITINFSLVYGLVDGVFEPVNSYTEKVSQVNTREIDKTKEKLEKLKVEFKEEEKRAKQEDAGFWGGITFVSSINDFFSNLYMNCIDLFLWGLEYLSAILFGAVKLVIRAVSLAFRIVLIVFGPFAFALSVLPIFKDNWKGWLSKYLNVCLFIPIANLMDLIINQLHLTLINSHIEVYKDAIVRVAEDAASVDTTMTTLTISYIIFLLAFLVLYLMIPSIASYIVSSAGMESITGGITLAGSFAASKMLSGTAQNPLTPNILRLFNRHYWTEKWKKIPCMNVVNIKEGADTPNVLIVNGISKKKIC